MVTTLLLAATLLSIERITYVWIWHWPASFQRICRRPQPARLGEPVDVLQKLFFLFKVIQLGVFLGWCLIFAGGADLLPEASLSVVAFGALLIGIGQFLNFAVFYRLGKVGVFYGNKLGYEVEWQEGFPFSLVNHPQYLGALISIWGFFLIMRYPYDDWMVLPLLQTFYYGMAIRFESGPSRGATVTASSGSFDRQ
jgi:protein-S-isoprenylcysteine O-methyltransferase Ste14